MTHQKRPTVNHLKREINVSTARSGGPGGQHVNKVETKVILKFNVQQSQLLSELEKEIIRAKYPSKLTKDGELIVSAEGKRSQLRNKEIAFKKLDRILARAFTKPKPRKKTQPSKTAIERRLKGKRIQSEKKKMRQKPG